MAHEKVHVICENLCLEEGMTKEEIQTRIIDVLDEITADTGWIDLSPYVGEGFAPRTSFPPQIRKIGNVVYLRGYIYSTESTQLDNKIILRLPEEFRPTDEFSNGSLRWGDWQPYSMYIRNNGEVYVGQSEHIDVQLEFAGYAISCISGYLVD